MQGYDWLAERFEGYRDHLGAVAYRMLGSRTEADDAVQEAWLRLSRADPNDVQNLGGWLTTVVARVCLDMLRSRKSRREEPIDERAAPHAVGDVEHDAVMADSVGLALLVVLDMLGPAERLAFVLHDMFAMPFDEIAPIVGRSPDATKMLASRARRRVQGASGVGLRRDPSRHRQIVGAFLAASRHGEFDALLEMLDPDVVMRADATLVQTGATAEMRGAHEVAGTFSGRAKAAHLALVGGAPGAVWSQGGVPRVVFAFTIEADRIVGIEMVGDPDRLEQLEIQLLDA